MFALRARAAIAAIAFTACATVIIARVAIATATYNSSNATITSPTAGASYTVGSYVPVSSDHTISFSRTVDSPDNGDRVGVILKNGTTQSGVTSVVAGSGTSHSWGGGEAGSWSYTLNNLTGVTNSLAVGSAAIWAKTNYTINNATEHLGTYRDLTITITN